MDYEYYEIDQLAERVNKLTDHNCKAITEYVNRFQKEFTIRFVHEATALEGNSLTLKEIRWVLNGKEPGGEDTKERKRGIQEVRNYFKAYQYERKAIKRGRALDERMVRILHEMVTERIHHGGIYRNTPVWVPNTDIEFPAHYNLRVLMRDFMERLVERVMVCGLPETFHPIDLAAWACMELIRIHPFLEGNERLGCLMMNYLLIEHRLLPVSIPKERRQEYLEIMNRYRWEREIVPFACLIEELEKEALMALEQGVRQVIRQRLG